MEERNRGIGFFDSGLGGLSVLREAIKIMPNEDYIYFGDSRNAPYGIKSVQEVRDLTFKAVDFLLNRGVKAIVIACNTATSAAINELREVYKDIPIVGIEPAVKPAVLLKPQGKVIIMATPVTLRQKKFKDLYEHYKSDTRIEPLPCPELVEFIEKGQIDGDEVKGYLKNKLKQFDLDDIGAIVLGCTHFPFVSKVIKEVVGEEVPIIDGGYGTAKQLRRLMEEKDIVSNKLENGHIEICNSLGKEEIITLSKQLLSMK